MAIGIQEFDGKKLKRRLRKKRSKATIKNYISRWYVCIKTNISICLKYFTEAALRVWVTSCMLSFTKKNTKYKF